MNFPLHSVRGVIARRLLVNFRVRPDVLANLLPEPFRPKLVGGAGLAGICLIRLEKVRPLGLPGFIGVASENAAHRIAVEWTEDGKTREGVYIPRRDTDLFLNRVLGGRLFPGWSHPADFEVEDDGFRVRLSVRDHEGKMSLSVDGCIADALPPGSVFRSADEASSFFRTSAVGWSPSRRADLCEGVELRCDTWTVAPFAISSVVSTYFDDRRLFPPGSIEFDCALLMRDIAHEWYARGRMKSKGDRP